MPLKAQSTHSTLPVEVEFSHLLRLMLSSLEGPVRNTPQGSPCIPEQQNTHSFLLWNSMPPLTRKERMCRPLPSAQQQSLASPSLRPFLSLYTQFLPAGRTCIWGGHWSCLPLKKSKSRSNMGTTGTHMRWEGYSEEEERCGQNLPHRRSALQEHIWQALASESKPAWLELGSHGRGAEGEAVSCADTVCPGV